MVRQERQEQILTGTLTEEPEDSLIHLSTGVVLKKKAIPKLVIKLLYDQYEEHKPEVPMFDNELKGRQEENPADPDYLKKVEDYETDFLLTMLNFSVMWGTELVSKPKNIEGVESTNWSQALEFSGVKVSEVPQIRYMMWVITVAAPEDSDAQLISQSLAGSAGVSEVAVNSELEKFPGDAQRESNPEITAEIPSPDRD